MSKPTTPTVMEMVKTALEAGGYGGLFNPRGCACEIGDIAPCGEIYRDCRAGYKQEGCTDECGIGCDWHIVDEKPEGK